MKKVSEELNKVSEALINLMTAFEREVEITNSFRRAAGNEEAQVTSYVAWAPAIDALYKVRVSIPEALEVK